MLTGDRLQWSAMNAMGLGPWARAETHLKSFNHNILPAEPSTQAFGSPAGTHLTFRSRRLHLPFLGRLTDDVAICFDFQ